MEKNNILTEAEAKSLLDAEQQKIELEQKTKEAVAQARATLISAESQRIRESQLAALSKIKKDFTALEKAVKEADLELFKTCQMFMQSCSNRMQIADNQVLLSAEIANKSRHLGVPVDQDLVFDASLFRERYFGLAGRNSFSDIYVRTWLVQTAKGRKELSSFDYVED